MSYLVDDKGFYGEFGGAYVPEILYATVRKLQEEYLPIIESEEFQQEYMQLLRDYVGRPSPLYFARRMSEKYGCQLYLKREDLNHTGAHKINNTIGQILLAKKMGKKRIIAETGAGQHGVATATVCALMDMPCVVYQGALDVERQHVNVERMKMLGAEVRPVKTGNWTLKDATNEAIRDWCCHPSDTFYIIGSTVGPHPYPDMVARWPRLSRLSDGVCRWRFECCRYHLPLYRRRACEDCFGRGWRTRCRHRTHRRYHPCRTIGYPARSKDASHADPRRSDYRGREHLGRS